MIQEEKLNNVTNKEYLSEITKSIIDATSFRPSPKIAKEQELLVMISKITDDKTMMEVRELYHSQYHAYDFDTYLP